jgi:hypothetical protein
MAEAKGSTPFDTALQNAWMRWNKFCQYDSIAMGKQTPISLLFIPPPISNNISLGLTITFFALLAPTWRYIASRISSPIKRRPFLTIPEYLFLADYAFEFPLMILNTPLGTPYSSHEIPSSQKILLQTFIILLLERAIYIFIPQFPQEHTGVEGKDRPATYNITSKEYVAPRASLFLIVFCLDFSAAAVDVMGRVHVISLGVFLFVRGLVDGGEAGKISW